MISLRAHQRRDSHIVERNTNVLTGLHGVHHDSGSVLLSIIICRAHRASDNHDRIGRSVGITVGFVTHTSQPDCKTLSCV